jgi:hypothetical protein
VAISNNLCRSLFIGNVRLSSDQELPYKVYVSCVDSDLALTLNVLQDGLAQGYLLGLHETCGAAIAAPGQHLRA